jgi:hypothetical protein
MSVFWPRRAGSGVDFIGGIMIYEYWFRILLCEAKFYGISMETGFPLIGEDVIFPTKG